MKKLEYRGLGDNGILYEIYDEFGFLGTYVSDFGYTEAKLRIDNEYSYSNYFTEEKILELLESLRELKRTGKIALDKG